MFPVPGASIRNSSTPFNYSLSIEAKLQQQVKEFEWKHWQLKTGTKIPKTYILAFGEVIEDFGDFYFFFYPFRISQSMLFWLPVITEWLFANL